MEGDFSKFSFDDEVGLFGELWVTKKLGFCPWVVQDEVGCVALME